MNRLHLATTVLAVAMAIGATTLAIQWPSDDLTGLRVCATEEDSALTDCRTGRTLNYQDGEWK